MSLIYPKEAWRRFGPGPLVVRDARGRVLRHVVACDPLTGEVIAHLSAGSWLDPLLIALERPMEAVWQFLARRGVRPSRRGRHCLVDRHWFAPAPLTITRLEA